MKIFISVSGKNSWFHKLSKEAQEQYIEDHPNSQYAKHVSRKERIVERKAGTGKLTEDLDPRFKEASKGLDPNILKQLSKLDEDFQQSFAKKFSGAMEEFVLDYSDDGETEGSLKFHRDRALKAKKEAQTTTNPIFRKKAKATFERERANYKELKLAQQKAKDIMKTPGKLEKFKNELGRKMLSNMTRVQADVEM